MLSLFVVIMLTIVVKVIIITRWMAKETRF